MRFADFSIEDCFVPRNNAGENGKSALGMKRIPAMWLRPVRV